MELIKDVFISEACIHNVNLVRKCIKWIFYRFFLLSCLAHWHLYLTFLLWKSCYHQLISLAHNILLFKFFIYLFIFTYIFFNKYVFFHKSYIHFTYESDKVYRKITFFCGKLFLVEFKQFWLVVIYRVIEVIKDATKGEYYFSKTILFFSTIERIWE